MSNITSKCEWLHCTTQPEPRGFEFLASSHALHLPCTSVRVFQCGSGDPRISEVLEVQESEVIWK